MRQSPLHDFHRERGAKFVDFAGWEMPISYTGIKEEHIATRTGATIFDVSHMGRLVLRGADATTFLDRVCTRRIEDMPAGLCRYAHVCREDGGILDDVIVSRRESDYLVVCNASNRQKIVDWFQKQAQGSAVTLVDQTLESGMVAIQGPHAYETVSKLLPVKVGDLARFHFVSGSMMGVSYYIARSGYTGEDGLEVIMPKAFAKMAAQQLFNKSAQQGVPILPAGLGARDTLRLEAGMPLYGHELTEDWDPITAGQKWCCALDKDFIGAERIREIAEQGPTRKLVGLEIDGPRIARGESTVFSGDELVGKITSGTLSPTLQKVIAMALVDSKSAAIGTTLDVEIRDRRVPATVVKLPFYKRA